ncbi:MAG: hypothetical protein NC428_00795 [Clostridium sp.]|nr:hypothetical protein [Clostridium sp.]
MLTTLAIQYRGEMIIRTEDIANSQRDFPEFADYLEKCILAGEQSQIIDETGGRVPWYFGTYSAVCIPFKLLLKLLGQPQIYCYTFANLFFYVLGVIFVAFVWKQKYFKRIILALLLMVNPALFYISWNSAEVFIFSLVVVSLTLWTNKKFKLSALVLAVVGTLNSTIMVLGLIYIIKYLFIDIKENGQKNYVVTWWKNKWDILLYASCYIPCLIPFLYYKIKFGVWNLQTAYGFANVQDGYIGRFLAYILDLNLGIMGYFPILLILFVILTINKCYKREFENVLYFLAFFGVIAAFSIMWHINCGMTGIARYLVWTVPIMLFGIVMMISEKKVYYTVLLVSVICSAIQINAYGIMFASNTSDIKLTPVAEKVLNKCPSLYWSLPSTFIDRVSHVSGGYNYSLPVIYSDEDSNVRKILLTGEDSSKIFEYICVDDKAERYILNIIEGYEDNKDFHFISIPPRYHVTINADGYLLRNCIVDSENNINKLITTGKMENNKIFLAHGEFSYGPYISLIKGRYLIEAHGDNLSDVYFQVTSDAGNNIIKIESASVDKNKISYEFEIGARTDNVEFLFRNDRYNSVRLDYIKLYIIN